MEHFLLITILMTAIAFVSIFLSDPAAEPSLPHENNDTFTTENSAAQANTRSNTQLINKPPVTTSSGWLSAERAPETKAMQEKPHSISRGNTTRRVTTNTL